jgi:hypothetical protein
MKTKHLVLTLLLVMSVGVGFATAQVVTEERAIGSDRESMRTDVREAVREALRKTRPLYDHR